MNNLIGKKFNRLLVLKEEPQKNGIRYFKCKCDCGNIKITRGSSLKNRKCKSCGCLQKEQIAELGRQKKTHGLSGTRFYRIWKGLFTRCYNENEESFKNYGGRGIKINKRWHNFKNFRDDMLAGYLLSSKKYGEKKISIERINNDGNYEEDNCKFILLSQQSWNRRPRKLTRKQMLEIKEKSKYIKSIELAKEYNVCSGVISEIKNGRRNYGKAIKLAKKLAK